MSFPYKTESFWKRKANNAGCMCLGMHRRKFIDCFAITRVLDIENAFRMCDAYFNRNNKHLLSSLDRFLNIFDFLYQMSPIYSSHWHKRWRLQHDCFTS